MEPIALLANIATINRGAYRNRQMQALKKSNSQQENTAIILGYDPSSGLYQVRDAGGNIRLARAITNSSDLGINSPVSLVIPYGGIPVIDGMPK